MADHAADLAESFKALPTERAVHFHESFEIDGLTVLMFRREFDPISRPDIRDGFKTVFGFGWLLIGFEHDSTRIEFKCGNPELAECFQRAFQDSTGLKLIRSEHRVFSAYDPAALEHNLLGGLPNDSKIQILDIEFSRSLCPTHSAVKVASSFDRRPIHQDLIWLREKNLLRLRSLTDVASIRFLHGTTDCVVRVDVEKHGAAVFRFKNANMAPPEAAAIRNEFRRVFGIPLNERIDPQRCSMGMAAIFKVVLESDYSEQLLDYHLEGLKILKDKGLITLEKEQRRVCKSLVCKNRLLPPETLDECPRCQSKPKSESVELIHHNDNAIRRVVKQVFQKSKRWRFHARPRAVEGHEFFVLENIAQPPHQVRVHVAENVDRKLLKLLEQSMHPIIVAHVREQFEDPVIDASGVAHVGFAHALAAMDSNSDWKPFSDSLEGVIDELLRRSNERISRAAAMAKRNLLALPNGYTANEFENDVFAIVRFLSPYAERWGGGSRPDGFCSMAYFENGQLRDVRKHNWSYDAKLNIDGAGYPLEAGEKRKAFDYVSALITQPELQSNHNQLDGHVFISNNIRVTTMKSTARFMRTEHRLGQDHPNVKLVFMSHEFLLALYDRVAMDQAGFDRRWPLFGKRVAHVMQQQNSDGYVRLTKNEANAIADWVLSQQPVETPVDINRLAVTLAETMNVSQSPAA